MKTNHTKDEQSEVRGIVSSLARDIESRLVHKLQIETMNTKGQSIEYRKGLRDMRHLVMEFTREIAEIPLTQTLTHLQEQHEREKRELVEEIKQMENLLD